MKLTILFVCVFILSVGCKKDKLPGSEITAQTIVGKWTVSKAILYSYKDDVLTKQETMPYFWEFEYRSDGTVGYTENNVSSSGSYTISYESGKYYYWNGIQGRYGAADDGKGEIKIINKDSFTLSFVTSLNTGYKYVLVETLVRK